MEVVVLLLCWCWQPTHCSLLHRPSHHQYSIALKGHLHFGLSLVWLCAVAKISSLIEKEQQHTRMSSVHQMGVKDEGGVEQWMIGTVEGAIEPSVLRVGCGHNTFFLFFSLLPSRPAGTRGSQFLPKTLIVCVCLAEGYPLFVCCCFAVVCGVSAPMSGVLASRLPAVLRYELQCLQQAAASSLSSWAAGSWPRYSPAAQVQRRQYSADAPEPMIIPAQRNQQQQQQQQTAAVPAQRQEMAVQLPDSNQGPWERVIDKTSGQPYWWNAKTGEMCLGGGTVPVCVCAHRWC